MNTHRGKLSVDPEPAILEPGECELACRMGLPRGKPIVELEA